MTTNQVGEPYPSVDSANPALADALRLALTSAEVDIGRGVALVGCGWVANEQLRSYSAAGVNVVGLFDRNRYKAVGLRDAHYPDARIYESFDAVLDDPGVEIVDITTHVESRAGLIQRAIDAGKHVLSQKPFVEDLAVGAELQRRAEQAGVVLAVNQNGRWAPHFGALLRCVAAGVIGQVVSADFFVAWEHDSDVASRPAAALFSSMRDLILFDFGAHWFDLVGVLAPDEQLQVHATTGDRVGQVIAVPTQAVATISSPSFLATLNFRAAERFAETGWYRVSGTEGVVSFSGRSLGGEQVTVTTSAGEATIGVSDDWFSHGMVGTLSALIRAIDTDREPPNSAQSSMRGLALCFAATASAQTGETVAAGASTRRIAGAVAGA